MLKKIILIISISLLFFASTTFSANSSTIVNTQFNPLTAQELKKIVSVVKKSPQYSEDILFSAVTLNEPAKADIDQSANTQRQAFLTLFNPKKNIVYEVLVNIPNGTIVFWKEIPKVQPLGGNYDYRAIPKLLTSNADWLEALKKRGIKDPDEVYVDPWLLEVSSDSTLKNHRLWRAVPFYLGHSQYMY